MTEQIEVASSQSQASAAWGFSPAVLKLAKRSGCPAFRGSRVHRAALIAWLRDHPETLAASDDDTAELKREKLALEVKILTNRHKLELESVMDTTDFKTKCQELRDIFSQEAQRLLESDLFRVFTERTTSRLSEIQTPFKTID